MSGLVLLDVGTTNARAWVTSDEEIVAHARAGFGVRDSARAGTTNSFRHSLGALIAQVREQSPVKKLDGVIGAGMLTSPLGLAEVPHVSAPAGLAEIARAVKRCSFPEIVDLPVWLVPGVRTGPAQYDLSALADADVMRGEETLCLGLLTLGLARPGETILNLGSHWKIIRLDSDGRIASSLTSLAGELIYAAQTQTILAESVPADRPREIDQAWCEAGIAEAERSHLPRALFGVRLLHLGGRSDRDERLSFAVGALIGADLPNVLKAAGRGRVVLTGGGAVGRAWEATLLGRGVRAEALDETQVERALLKGLNLIAGAARSNFI